MRERPILFSDPMVRAILAGTKTQTRRVVKREHAPSPGYSWAECLCREIDPSDTPCVVCEARFGASPYGAPGDRLWVREAWRPEELSIGTDGIRFRADDAFVPIENTPDAAIRWLEAYAGGRHATRWRPSIHMPRWASRLTLEVKSVRVERLQDITAEDARAEGARRFEGLAPSFTGSREPGWSMLDPKSHGELLGSTRMAFANYWNRLAGDADAWDANPWVWVVGFERVEVRP
jgi:hypothetical protein